MSRKWALALICSLYKKNKIKKECQNYRVYQFDEVEKFTYLETIISRQPGFELEIEARLMYVFL